MGCDEAMPPDQAGLAVATDEIELDAMHQRPDRLFINGLAPTSEFTQYHLTELGG